MKNKKLLAIISSILTIVIATSVCVAVFSTTKKTSTITVKTLGMDVTLGTPVVDAAYPLQPGGATLISVPVTNPNSFPVTLVSTQLTEQRWYDADGVTQVGGLQTQMLAGSSTSSYGDSSSNTTLQPGQTETFKLYVSLSQTADASYLNKVATFAFNMTFNQKA